MNTVLDTREHKLEYFRLLCGEEHAMKCEQIRTATHLRLIGTAIKRLADEIRLDDLVTFCQTGRYPE